MKAVTLCIDYGSAKPIQDISHDIIKEGSWMFTILLSQRHQGRNALIYL
jgi:hypothetical protein